MNILADASLPGLDHAFPKPFHLTRYYHVDEIIPLLPGQDVLLCRSTLKVDRSLVNTSSLLFVATASSGTDHLDHAWLHAQNIQVIDAKGSNARSVADYVVACLAFLEQNHFVLGSKAGIIGLGSVGSHVANRLLALDYQIFSYDPLKALHEPNTFQSCTLEELYEVDLLCIHAELHDTQPFPSANLINRDVLTRLKPGCILINAARGGVINEDDLLTSKIPLTYCTDVYLNEPHVDKRIIDKALLCTPHIAGHSLEAKYGAVAMVSEKLHVRLGQPLPQYAKPPMAQTLSIEKDSLWYETLLKIYNPFEETVYLKRALDKREAFLSLRKKHHSRHDFLHYSKEMILNYKIRLLLGR